MGAVIRVYVAGPYTASTDYDVAANVTRAIDAGIELVKRGWVPFVPHLTHFMELRSQEIGAGLDYETYMRMDQAWLECCDALLYLASSPGADRELAWAEAHGLTIYRSVLEVPPAEVVG